MAEKSEDNGTPRVSDGFPAQASSNQQEANINHGLSLSTLLGLMSRNDGDRMSHRDPSNPGIDSVAHQVRLLKALGNHLPTVSNSSSGTGALGTAVPPPPPRSNVSGDSASNSVLTALPTDSTQLLQSLLLQHQNLTQPNVATNPFVSHQQQAALLALLQASRSVVTAGDVLRRQINPHVSQASLPSTTPLLGHQTAAAPPLRPSPPPRPISAAAAPNIGTVSVQSSGTKASPAEQPNIVRSSSTNGAALPEQPRMDKKTLKRAANRISAQQSRRKKQRYIDELREENEQLRNMQHVLSLLPDLILTFDSSGVIRFASPASMCVFGSAPSDIQGTSFWKWICSKSARRLKAAFMDALANRRMEEGCTSVSLGRRIWEIRIKKRQKPDFIPDAESAGAASSSSSSWETYTLHGTVRFGEEGLPECICTIRLLGYHQDGTPISTASGGPHAMVG